LNLHRCGNFIFRIQMFGSELLVLHYPLIPGSRTQPVLPVLWKFYVLL